MKRDRIPIEDIIRLYEEEVLSLAEEAAVRVGLTRQGVHYRLVQAGARMRPPQVHHQGPHPPRFEREMMVRAQARKDRPLADLEAEANRQLLHHLKSIVGQMEAERRADD